MLRFLVHSFSSLLLFSILGCTAVQIPPEPEESDFFRTKTAGFHINAREGSVQYILLLEQKIPFEHPLHLTVFYENPADESDPFTENLLWPPQNEMLELLSPRLTSVRPEVFYKVTIEIFEDETKSEPIDLHETFIYSTIDTHSYGR